MNGFYFHIKHTESFISLKLLYSKNMQGDENVRGYIISVRNVLQPYTNDHSKWKKMEIVLIWSGQTEKFLF